MLFVTTYKVKPFISKAETAALTAVFAEAGKAPGEIAHYVDTDGGGGVIVSETSDSLPAYRNVLKYTQWLEFETVQDIAIDDAAGPILEALA